MFYALINITRIIAKILIYPKPIEENAIPVVIYGAGAAGKELMESVQIDKTKNLVAFYDDSKNLRDRSINNIPIYGAPEKLKDLKDKYSNLEVLLAIPSLDHNQRKDVISKLEELRISVRTVPAFHELIFDEKKMSDIQSLSMEDLIPEEKLMIWSKNPENRVYGNRFWRFYWLRNCETNNQPESKKNYTF